MLIAMEAFIYREQSRAKGLYDVNDVNDVNGRGHHHSHEWGIILDSISYRTAS